MIDPGNTASDLIVEHDRTRREFTISLGGDTAVLNYDLAPGIIDFTHTGVPEVFRGRGIAGRLVRAGLEFARAEHLAVVPSCPYVADYIRRNPEFEPLLHER